ncbi:unnamed protein product, partial [Ectocarpus sp. 8 AP-2014]
VAYCVERRKPSSSRRSVLAANCSSVLLLLLGHSTGRRAGEAWLWPPRLRSRSTTRTGSAARARCRRGGGGPGSAVAPRARGMSGAASAGRCWSSAPWCFWPLASARSRGLSSPRLPAGRGRLCMT